MYVAEGAERDGRLREAFKIAAEQGHQPARGHPDELDRMTGGAVHQGLAARIPAYEYAHADDLLDRAAEPGEKPLIVRSTRSPTRATSAPSSAAPPGSARTAW